MEMRISASARRSHHASDKRRISASARRSHHASDKRRISMVKLDQCWMWRFCCLRKTTITWFSPSAFYWWWTQLYSPFAGNIHGSLSYVPASWSESCSYWGCCVWDGLSWQRKSLTSAWTVVPCCRGFRWGACRVARVDGMAPQVLRQRLRRWPRKYCASVRISLTLSKPAQMKQNAGACCKSHGFYDAANVQNAERRHADRA